MAALARTLPEDLDGSFLRHPVRGVLVVLLTLAAIAQVARLSCFMSDDALRWGAAFPPVADRVEHMCQGSYVQAADLVRQGVPNVYAEEHYPAFAGADWATTEPTPFAVDNLGPYIRDAYEYPPQFLLMPRLALVASNDYMVHRTGWFLVQTLAFLAFALILVRRLDQATGLVALLLLPTVLAALPFLFTLQFGQWHLAAFLLAMAGMVAFTERNDALGGALLAAATVTKIFPGLLLVWLLATRRWSAVAWTVGFAVLYTALGLVVLGTGPFVAFATSHVPRIASGEAVSFFLRDTEAIARNFGVYGIPFKLAALGVPGMGPGLASALSWAYGLLLLGVAVVAARRPRAATEQPAVWLALLVLASLRSPIAPSVYVTAAAVWLLTLVAIRLGGGIRGVALAVVAWLLVHGLPPTPWPQVTMLLSMASQLAMMALAFWIALARPRGQPAG